MQQYSRLPPAIDASFTWQAAVRFGDAKRTRNLTINSEPKAYLFIVLLILPHVNPFAAFFALLSPLLRPPLVELVIIAALALAVWRFWPQISGFISGLIGKVKGGP